MEKVFVKNENPERWLMSGEFKYFPFKRNAAFTEAKISQVMMAQNGFLRSTSTAILHNIGNMKWQVPGTNKKYDEVLLGMTGNEKRLIHSVELTQRKEKLVLIVEKEELTCITGWLELPNKEMHDKVENVVEWKKLTGSEKKISLWGVESTPKQMEYAQDLMESTRGAVVNGTERNLQRPPRKRYSAGGIKVEIARVKPM